MCIYILYIYIYLAASENGFFVFISFSFFGAPELENEKKMVDDNEQNGRNAAEYEKTGQAPKMKTKKNGRRKRKKMVRRKRNENEKTIFRSS